MNSAYLTLIQSVPSDDGSVKFLWNCADGARIESVVLPRDLKARKKIGPWVRSGVSPPDLSTSLPTAHELLTESPRATVCVSSQVGCAMACDFCATGKLKLTRNLSAQEILEQVNLAKEHYPVTNVVFMGMGEPLHNLVEVRSALRGLYQQGFSRRKITVSTSGLIPGILELSENERPRLAISLNATTDALRDSLMPVNKKYPIADLLNAAKVYAEKSKLPVMLEYVLLQGMNDTAEDQQRLFDLSNGWNCQVNLIPLNAGAVEIGQLRSPVPFVRPEPETVKSFQHFLVSRGITATVRYSGADDVGAACGQLAGKVS